MDLYNTYYVLLFSICAEIVYCQDVYKAAIVKTNKNSNYNFKNYPSLIHEAASLGADILLLDSQYDSKFETKECVIKDEKIKTIAKAASEAGIYVAAYIFEEISCDMSEDVVRSSLIFNRNGDIVFAYRKPSAQANCNATYAKTGSFTTDFGVTLGVLMEEDIILQSISDASLNNYIILGAWPHKSDGLHELNIEPSWSFATKSNIISVNGIYGNTKASTLSGNIFMKEINKNRNDYPQLLKSQFVFPKSWSPKTIRPLDMKLAAQGLKEELCFEEFCCQFYIKTDSISSNPYSLVINTEVMNIGDQILSTQSCSLVACAGPNKSCTPFNKDVFKIVSISGNFSLDATQLPILHTSTEKNVKFELQNLLDSRHVNMEINDSDVSTFGIFNIEVNLTIDSYLNDFVSYINEDVQQFFDYVWIRLRVVIFIVSIYILEMM